MPSHDFMKFRLPEAIIETDLKAIRSIAFTQKELHIIAGIVGRMENLDLFFSLSPKTVSTHKRNIKGKMGVTTQEGIINFVEQSPEFRYVRELFLSLRSQKVFEQKLKAFAQVLKGQRRKGMLLDGNRPDTETAAQIVFHKGMIDKLQAYLSDVGVDIAYHAQLETNTIENHILVAQKEQQDFVLVCHSLDIEKEEDVTKGTMVNEKIVSHAMPIRNMLVSVLLLDQEQNKTTASDRATLMEASSPHRIRFTNTGEDFMAYLHLCQRLWPEKDMDSLITGMQDQIRHIWSGQGGGNTGISNATHQAPYTPHFLNKGIALILNSRKHLIFMSALLIGLTLVGTYVEKIAFLSPFNKKGNLFPIRSDLLIPAEATLLRRPQLTSVIEKKLKGTTGIQIVALAGIGGAGKTTLARQYARIQKAPIVWEINGETKNSVLSSFNNLAYALARTKEDKQALAGIQEIKEASDREKKLLPFVKDHLKTYPSWFLVYDNVDSLAEIKDFFPFDPNTWGNGKVLLTTRDTNIANNSYISHVNVIPVEELNDAEKLNLFNRIYDTPSGTQKSNIQDTQKIAFLKEIPPFPLDISVAAYYIKDTKIAYDRYLAHLSAEGDRFSSVQETLLKDVSEYTKTRHKIITLALKNLIATNSDYQDLLFFISLIDSQDIPRDLLVAFKNETLVDAFLHDMRKNALISLRENRGEQFDNEKTNLNASLTFSIHRSTQQIFYGYFSNRLLSLNSPIDRNNFFQQIDKVFEEYVSYLILWDEFPQMRLMIGHINTLVSHKELVSNNMITSLEYEVGRIYHQLGDFKKSNLLLVRILKDISSSNEKQTVKYARTLIHAGEMERAFSRFGNAKKFVEEGVSIFKGLYGNDHPQTAWAQITLGTIYKELGKFDRARSLIEQSIAVYRKYTLHYEKEIGPALVRLGEIYFFLGKHMKAQEAFQESVSVHTQHYGEHHVKTAWSSMHLASLMISIGNYQEAKNVFLKGISTYDNNYGKDHISTFWALTRLGYAYQRLNDYKNGLHYIKKSVSLHEDYFGKNHIRTAWAKTYLGCVYNDIGEYAKAKETLAHSFEIHQEFYGDSNVKTAWARANLANAYRNLKDYAKAEKLLYSSLIVYEKHYGKDNIETADVLRDLGDIYLLQGKIDAAEPLLKRSHAIFEKHNHPERLVLRSKLEAWKTPKLMKLATFTPSLSSPISHQ